MMIIEKVLRSFLVCFLCGAAYGAHASFEPPRAHESWNLFGNSMFDFVSDDGVDPLGPLRLPTGDGYINALPGSTIAAVSAHTTTAAAATPSSESTGRLDGDDAPAGFIPWCQDGGVDLGANLSACAVKSNPHEGHDVPLPGRMFACSECGYVTSKNRRILEHRRTHTGERPFACTQCNFTTAYKGHLAQHVSSVHQGVKRHVCNQCSYASAYASDLATHVLRMHVQQRSLKCELCGFVAARCGGLTYHRRCVHSKFTYRGDNKP